MDQTQTTKSFWKKGEGKVTKWLLGIFGIGGSILLYAFLPILITLLQNTLYAGLLIITLGIILYALMDPQCRAIMFFIYKGILHKTVGQLITMDPIGIIENYISDLNKRQREADEQISKVKGQIRIFQNTIDENKRKKEKDLEIASAAKKNKMEKDELLSTREAARLDEANIELNDFLIKLQKLYSVLVRIYDMADFTIKDTTSKMEIEKSKYKALQAGYSAFKAASEILKGDPDKKAIFDRTLESMADSLGNKIGEMDRFMEVSGSILNHVDLQKGILEDKGFTLLEQWEKDNSLLLGNNKLEMLPKLGIGTPELVSASDKTKNKYGNLVN